ncbi:pulmonary surfactant-associated protein D-like [Gastrophryne carolinensis]
MFPFMRKHARQPRANFLTRRDFTLLASEMVNCLKYHFNTNFSVLVLSDFLGATGAQGGTGAPGPRGERGPPGPKGDKGQSVMADIEAFKARVAALEATAKASVEIVRRYVKFSSRGASGPYVSAKAECASLKGHVALPRSAAENKEVLKLVQKYGKNAWLGTTDSKYEGAFWDRNGQLIVYSQWVPGQPDHYLGNEHCVDMDTNGEWSDSRCDLYRIIICEIPFV